jgi:hypothetical protein
MVFEKVSGYGEEESVWAIGPNRDHDCLTSQNANYEVSDLKSKFKAIVLAKTSKTWPKFPWNKDRS